MSNQKIIEILKTGLERIEGGWCQRTGSIVPSQVLDQHPAKRADVREGLQNIYGISTWEEGQKFYCATGALVDLPGREAALRYLVSAINKIEGVPLNIPPNLHTSPFSRVINWNDRGMCTKEDVVLMYKTAISLAEAE